MPVQNGAAASCRKPNVGFVRVLSSIDFALLVTIVYAGPTILCSQYYIELSQTTVPLVNGVGVNYNLTTWHGTADLLTLSGADVCGLILEGSLISNNELNCVSPIVSLLNGALEVDLFVILDGQMSYNSVPFLFYGLCPESQCNHGYCSFGQCEVS